MCRMLIMEQAGNPDCQLPARALMLAVLQSCGASLLLQCFCNENGRHWVFVMVMVC